MNITVNPLPVTSIITGEALLCNDAINKVYQVVNTPGSTYAWTLPAMLNIVYDDNLYFILTKANGALGTGNVQVI